MASYQHLDLSERAKIKVLKLQGLTNRGVGKALGRSHTSIGRELACNDRGHPQMSGYVPELAQALADNRKSEVSRRPRLKSQAVRDFVHEKLLLRWTPEQISAVSQKMIGTAISHEAIYQYIYNDYREGIFYLARSHKQRYPRKFSKKSVVAYGWWIVFVASGFLVGSFISNRLLAYLCPLQIMKLGTLSLVFFSIVMSILALLKVQSVLIVVLPMFFILASSGMIYPQFVAESLSPFPKMAGSAGALIGFMVFLGGTLASVIISHLHENNVIPLATMILTQSILVLIFYFGIKTKE